VPTTHTQRHLPPPVINQTRRVVLKAPFRLSPRNCEFYTCFPQVRLLLVAV
jgi:hypothetical protein